MNNNTTTAQHMLDAICFAPEPILRALHIDNEESLIIAIDLLIKQGASLENVDTQSFNLFRFEHSTSLAVTLKIAAQVGRSFFVRNITDRILAKYDSGEVDYNSSLESLILGLARSIYHTGDNRYDKNKHNKHDNYRKSAESPAACCAGWIAEIAEQSNEIYFAARCIA